MTTEGGASDEDPASDVVREITDAGGEAIAHRGDIGDTAVGAELVELALDTWGRLDIVINNAGFGRPRMVFNLSDDEWDDVIRVHLRGTFVMSRPACRYWRAAGEAARLDLRAHDQHRDRPAPLRRCRAVELRRGEGRHPGVHRSDRDRDGALRRDREHDHARREHAARADRLAHGAGRRPGAATRPSTCATRCTSASSAAYLASPKRAGSPGRRSRCGAGPSSTSTRGGGGSRAQHGSSARGRRFRERDSDCSVRRRAVWSPRPWTGRQTARPNSARRRPRADRKSGSARAHLEHAVAASDAFGASSSRRGPEGARTVTRG